MALGVAVSDGVALGVAVSDGVALGVGDAVSEGVAVSGGVVSSGVSVGVGVALGVAHSVGDGAGVGVSATFSTTSKVTLEESFFVSVSVRNRVYVPVGTFAASVVVKKKTPLTSPSGVTVSGSFTAYSVPSVPITVTVAVDSGVKPVPEKPMPSSVSAMSVWDTSGTSTVASGASASAGTAAGVDGDAPSEGRHSAGAGADGAVVDATAGTAIKPETAAATAGASTRLFAEVFTVWPFGRGVFDHAKATVLLPALRSRGKAPSARAYNSTHCRAFSKGMRGSSPFP